MGMSFYAGEVLVGGLVATAMLDLWQLAVKGLFGVPPTNWAFVGRWMLYIPAGKFRHRAIAETTPVSHEATAGWLFHYLIGVIYAAVYLILVQLFFNGAVALPTAVAFGAVTVVAPWFVLQPGMGLGVLASNAKQPNVVLAHSLSSHLVFGVGLYFGAIII
jgi:hypothetical protein